MIKGPHIYIIVNKEDITDDLISDSVKRLDSLDGSKTIFAYRSSIDKPNSFNGYQEYTSSQIEEVRFTTWEWDILITEEMIKGE